MPLIDALVRTFCGRAAGRPLLALMLAFVAVWLLAEGWRRAGFSTSTLPRVGAALPLIGALAALTVFAVVMTWYTFHDVYADHVEPNTAIVSWLFLQGFPLYHDLDAAERYSLLYGPALYLTHALFLSVLGGSILSSKLVGWVGAAASLCFTFLALRRVATTPRAVTLTGLAALVYLLFGYKTFWARPEPLLLACAAGALWSVTSNRRVTAVVGVALGLAMAVNLKFTAAVYLLPTLALLRLRHGFAPLAWGMGAAVVFAAVPFVASDRISFLNYLSWVELAGRHPPALRTLVGNLDWVLFLLVPAAGWLRASRDGRTSEISESLFVAAFAAAVLGAVVVGGVPGAWHYHLIPFVPVILFVAATVNPTFPAVQAGPRRPLWLAFLAMATMIALCEQRSFVRAYRWVAQAGIATELHAIAQDFPDVPISMGYGGVYWYTFYRPLLVFWTNAYLLDGVVVMEDRWAGERMPPGTLQAMRECRIPVWVIPRNGEPFDLRDYYTGESVFGREFVQIFNDTYGRVRSTDHFDVWECRGD